jgi:hypothetical protein
MWDVLVLTHPVGQATIHRHDPIRANDTAGNWFLLTGSEPCNQAVVNISTAIDAVNTKPLTELRQLTAAQNFQRCNSPLDERK